MTTQKRRVVYLSDEEWEGVKHRADALGLTMSAYIRSSLVGGAVIPMSIQRLVARVNDPAGTAEPASRFNRRPFTPVPKKGK